MDIIKNYLFQALVIIIIILIPFPAKASAVIDDNCKNATNNVEKIICRNSTLYYLNDRMKVYYNDAERSLPAKQKTTLLKEQQDWLNNRAKLCKIPPQVNFNGDEWHSYEKCLIEQYKYRNYQLFKVTVPLKNNQFHINVTNNINFADFTAKGNITSTEIQRLTYAKIDGDHQFPEGLKSDDGKHMVQNCHDYWKYGIAAEGGATADMSMAAYFTITCGVLKKLQFAKKPNVSYLNDINIYNTNKLSLIFLPVMTDESYDLLKSYDAKGLSIEDLILKGLVKLEKKSAYSIEIYYNETGLYSNINEIARADFNGNGVEYILLSVINHVDFGTYRSYHVCTATRFKKDKTLSHFNCFQ